jgi:hypothetical protein
MANLTIKMSEFSTVSDCETQKINEKVNISANREMNRVELEIGKLEAKIGKNSLEIKTLCEEGECEETRDICNLLGLLIKKEHYSRLCNRKTSN